MEFWDVYDRDKIKTGDKMVRGDKYKSGAYHLVIHVVVFNSKNQMLIQQRQPFKKDWSNMWDITVGGSAIAGESSREAAEREVLEEIGYKINLKDKRPALTVNWEHGFDDIYLIEDDININDLNLQYEEVQRVKWADKDEILSMIEDRCFIPYYESFINILFDLRNSNGVHDMNRYNHI